MALIANTYHIYNCKLPFHVLFIIQYTCMYAQTHTYKRTWLMCCVSISLWCRSSKKTVSTTVYHILRHICNIFSLFNSPTHYYYCCYYFIGIFIGIYRWCVHEFRTRKSKPSFWSAFFPLYHFTFFRYYSCGSHAMKIKLMYAKKYSYSIHIFAVSLN